MAQTVVENQIHLFLYACLFGMMLGVYYDLFRFMREIGLNSDVNVLIQDIFFTVSIAPLTFLFFTAFNNGVIRIFVLLGQFAGFLLYRYTLGELSIRLFKILIIPIKFIIQLIKKPFHVFELFLIKKIKSLKFMHEVNKKKHEKEKLAKKAERKAHDSKKAKAKAEKQAKLKMSKTNKNKNQAKRQKGSKK